MTKREMERRIEALEQELIKTKEYLIETRRYLIDHLKESERQN